MSGGPIYKKKMKAGYTSTLTSLAQLACESREAVTEGLSILTEATRGVVDTRQAAARHRAVGAGRCGLITLIIYLRIWSEDSQYMYMYVRGVEKKSIIKTYH